MARPEFLIVGLGNPGARYRGTRHNAGAALVEAVSRAHGVSLGQSRHRSFVGEGFLGGRRCLFALPQTYMNLSGLAVADLVAFSEVPLSRLLVVHDDLDLPLGAIRLREGGGSGGHRGVRSIMESVGSGDFLRLKVGIGRPPEGRPAEGYVLEPFTPGERESVARALARGVEAVEHLVEEGPGKTMSLFNASA